MLQLKNEHNTILIDNSFFSIENNNKYIVLTKF